MRGSGNLDIIHYEEIESTNKTAKEMLRAGHIAPFCIVADTQTGGVGRAGKTFWSPRGGLYMTAVLHESHFEQEIITSIVAERLAGLLRFASKGVTIKGVNDIMLDGKKVAGILVEKVKDCFIIGIGINIKPQEVPKELEGIVGFLGGKVEIDEIIKLLSNCV